MDLEALPDEATRLCLEAQQRLEESVRILDDAALIKPSRLPGWTRAHVVTHLARNADAHSRRIAGALDGRDVAKYVGGAQQRHDEIERGAARDAPAVRDDLVASQARLANLLRAAGERQWPNAHFLGGGHYGVGACPAHRLREVEMHHVDLGVDYSPSRWPWEYVAWEMALLVTSVPERMHELPARQSFLAWLAGRGDVDPTWRLDPWG